MKGKSLEPHFIPSQPGEMGTSNVNCIIQAHFPLWHKYLGADGPLKTRALDTSLPPIYIPTPLNAAVLCSLAKK